MNKLEGFRSKTFSIAFVLTIFCTAPLWTTSITRAQSGAQKGEWRTYGGDLGNTRYASLDQINAQNFSKLEVAWRFKTDNLGPRPETQLSPPLMVNGVLYSTGGTRRAVVALDAGTGELLALLWCGSIINYGLQNSSRAFTSFRRSREIGSSVRFPSFKRTTMPPPNHELTSST